MQGCLCAQCPHRTPEWATRPTAALLTLHPGLSRLVLKVLIAILVPVAVDALVIATAAVGGCPGVSVCSTRTQPDEGARVGARA